MRDWRAFVRERLRLPGLAPEREARIVRELAAQLEDFYRDARASGASPEEADAHACRQVRDWDRMAADLLVADRAHARPRLERLTDALEDRSQRGGRERSGASGEARAQRSELGGVQGSPPFNRGGQMIADVLRDARYAIRQLTRSPGFAIVALLTLALGIGATSAMFSVVNGVLLKPLPVPESERLVRVNEIVPQYGRFSVAPANFLDWRAQSTSFERIVAITPGTATFTAADGPERVTNATVSWDFFELAKVQPFLGRGFTADEDVPGKNGVVVLSHRTWQRRFGADPGIVGRAITLSGAPATVVGVMPAGFEFPRDAEYWTPIALNPASATRGGHFLAVLARLKPGVTAEQAAAEMQTIAARLAKQYPQSNANESAEVVPLLEQTVGNVREPLLALLAAVGVVILIVCANVANLLLVRASVRDKEIAIRTALGAGRARLVRQMLAESLILAAAGGALGVLLAYLTIRPIQTLSAGSIPRVQDVSIDTTVLLFALGVSLATGVLFGLAPAWQASRASAIAGVLKEGGRSSATGGGRWMRGALLVAEVALSLILLVGAALLLRSFARLTSVDPGFRAEQALAFRVSLPSASYREDHDRAAFFETLLSKLEASPQVRAAGVMQSLPMRGDYVLSFEIQGRPKPAPNSAPSANYRAISPNLFAALGVPLKRGRGFSDRDNSEKAPQVVIVDEAFVARHFPNEDPIGRGLDIGNGTDGFFEIVGVVGNVRSDALDSTPEPTMYAPFRHDVFSTMWILVGTDGDPAHLASVARQAVREIDRALPAYSIMPLVDVVSDSVAQRRFSMLLLAAFAAMAVFLAAVGIYGVVAYSVSQRTQEIGVRLAIGAERRDVLALVLGGGLKLALVGVALGVAGALALSRLIEAMLFDVQPFDPPSYLATAVLLMVIAALACYVPARRAMRVDPIIAIRQE